MLTLSKIVFEKASHVWHIHLETTVLLQNQCHLAIPLVSRIFLKRKDNKCKHFTFFKSVWHFTKAVGGRIAQYPFSVTYRVR